MPCSPRRRSAGGLQWSPETPGTSGMPASERSIRGGGRGRCPTESSSANHGLVGPQLGGRHELVPAVHAECVRLVGALDLGRPRRCGRPTQPDRNGHTRFPPRRSDVPMPGTHPSCGRRHSRATLLSAFRRSSRRRTTPWRITTSGWSPRLKTRHRTEATLSVRYATTGTPVFHTPNRPACPTSTIRVPPFAACPV